MILQKSKTLRIKHAIKPELPCNRKFQKTVTSQKRTFEKMYLQVLSHRSIAVKFIVVLLFKNQEKIKTKNEINYKAI